MKTNVNKTLFPLKLQRFEEYYLHSMFFIKVHVFFLFGLTVTEWGDDVRPISEEEAMVIVNHQSTGDVCTLMMCLQDKGTVRKDRDLLLSCDLPLGESV